MKRTRWEMDGGEAAILIPEAVAQSKLPSRKVVGH